MEMKNECLPIGTVIKTKENKLAIIIGYGGYLSSINEYQSCSEYDYKVSSYPFDCMNVKNNFKLYKNINWFDFNLDGINKDEIESIIFMGYIGEEFEQIKNNLNK